MDRAKIIQALELCDGVYKCPESCPYWGKEPCGINADILALLKEQDSEKKRIMKVIWETLHEGLSIDTEVDQDWVYEQIRHRIEDI